MFFLPQSPYVPPGEERPYTTLREQLLYPDSKATDAELRTALDAASLEIPLSMSDDWSTTLSGGEKQRVAFARLLVQLGSAKHPLVLLDEATSACDEDLENQLYTVLLRKIALLEGGVVSVGHRSSLRAHHTHTITLKKQVQTQSR